MLTTMKKKTVSVNNRDITLARVFGGLMWPFSEPGCGVVLGETLNQNEYGTHDLYVIALFRNRSLPDLIDRCVEVQNAYENMAGYYTRTDDSFFAHIRYINKLKRLSGEYCVRIKSAPNSESGIIDMHISMVRDRLNPSSVTLYSVSDDFSADLAGAFNSLKPHEMQVKDIDNPVLAAYGYAVAALNMTDRPEPDVRYSFGTHSNNDDNRNNWLAG